jgi:hypothetical protein
MPVRAKLLYTMVTLQLVIAFISVVLIFLQCTPTAMLWDPFTPNGKCWEPKVFNDFNYFVSAYTTLTDIVLAVVPVSVIWKLQMPFSTKLGVCIMMGLTLLSAIVTIVKATYLHLFADRMDPRECWPTFPIPSHRVINKYNSLERGSPSPMGPHRAKRCPRRGLHPDPATLLPQSLLPIAQV